MKEQAESFAPAAISIPRIFWNTVQLFENFHKFRFEPDPKISGILFVFLMFSGCSGNIGDRLKTYLTEGNYESCLSFLKDKEELSDSELYQGSLCVNGLQASLRKTSIKTGINPSSIKSIENKTGLKFFFNDKTSPPFIQIDDTYYTRIAPGNFYKEKALIEKFIALHETSDSGENLFLLIDILKIDPGNFPDEFIKLVLVSLKTGLLSSLPDEEKNKFINLIHYLSQKDTNDFSRRFFEVDGTNVNVRSGPGTEYPVVEHLTGEKVFQIDSDFNTISLAGKTGKWVQIYIWSKESTGWIFSGFLKKNSPNPDRIASFKNTLLKSNPMKVIEFDNWSGEEIPDGFNGNYYRSERTVRSGKVGYPIYYAGKKENFICTPVSRKLSKLLVSFEVISDEKITLFKITGIRQGKKKNLFEVKLASTNIQINENSFLLKEKGTDNLELEFADELIVKVTGSLGSMGSDVKLSKDWQDSDSMELCIPSSSGTSPGGILYQFKLF